VENGLRPVGRLWLKAISAALDVPIPALLAESEPADESGADLPTTKQVHALVTAFLALPEPLRAEVADLVSALGRQASGR
jgi:hypothetical protein